MPIESPRRNPFVTAGAPGPRPSPADGAPRVLVVARRRAAREAAVAALGPPEFDSRGAELVESLTADDLAPFDAVVILPDGSAVRPDIACCRVRALLPGCAVVTARVSPGPAEAAGPGGPGVVASCWPAAGPELRAALRRALAGAALARALRAAGAPEHAVGGLALALQLGQVDGHPGWFLEALRSALGEPVAGGAVLVPVSDGSWRVAAADGFEESHVLRLVRRHPPPAGTVQPAARHVRIPRVLRSASSRLRALRGWWWLAGPPCAGAGAWTILLEERARADAGWVDGALEALAAASARGDAGEPGDWDPATGLEWADADRLAGRALALVRENGEGRPSGVAVLLVRLRGMRDARRASGPRSEAGLVCAAAGLVRRAHRPADPVFRVAVDALAAVVPAAGPAQAELLAGRLDERLGGRRLLTRAGEGAGAGGLRVDAEVRAVFAEGADDPATIAARLERLGVRRAGPAVSEP